VEDRGGGAAERGPRAGGELRGRGPGERVEQARGLDDRARPQWDDLTSAQCCFQPGAAELCDEVGASVRAVEAR
jgi:hypothetical protein